jgi:hypothetical protein
MKVRGSFSYSGPERRRNRRRIELLEVALALLIGALIPIIGPNVVGVWALLFGGNP